MPVSKPRFSVRQHEDFAAYLRRLAVELEEWREALEAHYPENRRSGRIRRLWEELEAKIHDVRAEVQADAERELGSYGVPYLSRP